MAYVNYRTVRNIGSEKTGELQHFANFYNFHNIPYANGLQFAKVSSAILIRQTFLLPKFFTVW